MDVKEAVEILNQYPDDWFEYELEDAQFGDGSYSINFNTLFDSKNEAKKLPKL